MVKWWTFFELSLGSGWRVQPHNLYDVEVTKASLDPADDKAYQENEYDNVEDIGITNEIIQQR